MPYLHLCKAYLRHWLNVVDQHSIHSPFFFDFYTKVVKGTTAEHEATAIEGVRAKLIQDNTWMPVVDLGAGSKHLKGNQRRLGDIAATSLTPAVWAQLYHRICMYQQANRIVELGTSFGITTLYLSSVEGAEVYTFEGSPAIADVALTNFEYFERKNIHVFTGDIQAQLPDFLQDPAHIDFALMDANHRYEPTLKYFEWLMKRLTEKSIVVVDDIHQSPEMEQAWNELTGHALVYGSVDLFRCGLLFFDPALNHQHFVWSI